MRNTDRTLILHITCCPDPCYARWLSADTQATLFQIRLLFRYMTLLCVRTPVLKRITSQSMLVTTLGFPPHRTHAVLSPSRMWALQQDLQQVVENSFRKKAWGVEILTFWQRIKFFYLSFDLLKAFSRKRFAWIIHPTSHTRGKKCECCGWKECPPPS